MNLIYLYTISSLLIVSLISLIGVLTLSIKKEFLEKILFLLVSFAVGALLGDVFIHLIPEISQNGWNLAVSLYLLGGIVLFLIMEKIISWRHCHIPTSQDHPHHLGIMNLIGDGVHNFIDGALIAGSFLVSIPLGLATTLAVILHEIPQEIGDFGILLYAGYQRARALFFNFLSALLAIIGALVVLILQNDQLIEFLLPFTAGGFLYIAAADLIPEMKKEQGLLKNITQLVAILLGIGVMILLLKLQ